VFGVDAVGEDAESEGGDDGDEEPLDPGGGCLGCGDGVGFGYVGLEGVLGGLAGLFGEGEGAEDGEEGGDDGDVGAGFPVGEAAGRGEGGGGRAGARGGAAAGGRGGGVRGGGGGGIVRPRTVISHWPRRAGRAGAGA